MSNEELQRMKELDEAAERAGGYVSYMPDSKQHYDYRKLLDYCRKKGIDPLDITIRELNKFYYLK